MSYSSTRTSRHIPDFVWAAVVVGASFESKMIVITILEDDFQTGPAHIPGHTMLI